MMGTAGPHSTFTFKLECITRREFPSVQYCTGGKREAQATRRNGERKAVRPALRPEESDYARHAPARDTGRLAGAGMETRAGMRWDATYLTRYDLGKVGDTHRFAVDR
jgi:hypothetical protein